MTSNRPLPPTNHEPTKLTRLTRIEVQKAAPKVVTCMPGNIHATKATMPALMTSRNKPRVRMVIGRVSKMAMGRTMEFTTPSSMPARTNVEGVSMETPETQSVASHSPRATNAARMRNPSIVPSLLDLSHLTDISIATPILGATLIIKPGERRILGYQFYGFFRDGWTFQRHFDASHEAFPAHANARIASVPLRRVRDSGPQKPQRRLALAPARIQDEIVHRGAVAPR